MLSESARLIQQCVQSAESRHTELEKSVLQLRQDLSRECPEVQTQRDAAKVVDEARKQLRNRGKLASLMHISEQETSLRLVSEIAENVKGIEAHLRIRTPGETT